MTIPVEEQLEPAENPFNDADVQQPSIEDLINKFASLNEEAEERPQSDGEDSGGEGEGAGEGVREGSSNPTAGGGGKKKKKKKSKAAKAVQKMKDLTTGTVPMPDEIIQAVQKQQRLEGREAMDEAEINRALKAANFMKILQGKEAVGNASNTKDVGTHKFWNTQPVPQMFAGTSEAIIEGPIDPPKTVTEVRQEPLPLPAGYEWCTVDVMNPEQLKEIQTLLSENYVEDDDASFRLNYSKDFLLWALTPPGWVADWHIGIRVASNKKVIAFISGIKVEARVRDNTFEAAEINFLVAHKKLRSKRLAPVLIKEVTRRVNLRNIWQAVYTAGVVIPTPIGTCRYYHRNLNPPKLVDIGFTPLGRGETVSRMIKKYALPTSPLLPGLREMVPADVPQVKELLRKYMARFELTQMFERDEEVEHWFLSGQGRGESVGGKPRDGQVIWSYVVEDPSTHLITDFFSFYSLPSLVMKHPKHNIVNTAYSFYYATDVPFTASGSEADVGREQGKLGVRLNALCRDAMIIAKQAEFDVFNALSLMDNNLFLKEQLFGQGDGVLNYYLYNWRCAPVDGAPGGALAKQTSQVGLVML